MTRTPEQYPNPVSLSGAVQEMGPVASVSMALKHEKSEDQTHPAKLTGPSPPLIGHAHNDHPHKTGLASHMMGYPYCL